MDPLAMMAIGIGVAAILGKWKGLADPAAVRAFMKAFPRSQAWGWALLTVDMVVVSLLLWNLPVDWIRKWRPVLFLLCPASIYLVGRFVDELLAPRMLGGLLLLMAAPVLEAARFHPSQARLVMTILAYSWVFPGMLLVASPWWFRKATDGLLRTDTRIRIGSAFGLLLGVVLIVLGVTVY